MKQIYLLWHLGLGDAIICNGMVRHLVKESAKIFLPCKNHNLDSVRFMFRDEPKVEVMPVANDDHARDIARVMRPPVFQTIRLGLFSGEPVDMKAWDAQFYRQAGVPLSARWELFRVDRDPAIEFQHPGIKFALVHEDLKRNVLLKPEALPQDMRVIKTENKGPIFRWINLIERATELHFMESTFAILADMYNIPGQHRVLHTYARQSAAPSYRSNWLISKGELIRPDPAIAKQIIAQANRDGKTAAAAGPKPAPPVHKRSKKWGKMGIDLPKTPKIPKAAKKNVDEAVKVS